MLLLNQSSNQ